MIECGSTDGLGRDLILRECFERLKAQEESEEITRCDPTGSRLDNEPDKWRLVTDAFLDWKLMVDEKRRAKKAGEQERSDRLSALSTKAWQRYVRRWSSARRGSP